MDVKKILIILSMLVVLMGVVGAKDSDAIKVSECMTLDQEGANYVLTESITIDEDIYNCITIRANSITFDLNGFSIIGDGIFTGFDSAIGNYGGYDNISIKNGEIHNFSFGIYFSGGSDSSFTDLKIESPVNFGDPSTGIFLWMGANNNVISDSDISIINENSSAIGISILFSNGNLIKNNNLNSNLGEDGRGYGISIRGSNNIIQDNSMCGNGLFDIKNKGLNSGDGNSCDSTSDWNDDGTTDCTYTCEEAEQTAEDFCGSIEIDSKKDFKTCRAADWKDNEDKKPKDCSVKKVKKSKDMICVARKNAD